MIMSLLFVCNSSGSQLDYVVTYIYSPFYTLSCLTLVLLDTLKNVLLFSVRSMIASYAALILSVLLLLLMFLIFIQTPSEFRPFVCGIRYPLTFKKHKQLYLLKAKLRHISFRLYKTKFLIDTHTQVFGIL